MLRPGFCEALLRPGFCEALLLTLPGSLPLSSPHTLTHPEAFHSKGEQASNPGEGANVGLALGRGLFSGAIKN